MCKGSEGCNLTTIEEQRTLIVIQVLDKGIDACRPHSASTDRSLQSKTKMTNYLSRIRGSTIVALVYI